MKRLFSLFLCLLMIVGCFAGCKKKTVPTVASGEQITRGAWVKLLADSLYLNSTTEKPYFSDIVKDDELFNAVQACVDLGIIEAGDLFNKGNAVTYKEIALNAVNAIGISTVQDYLKTDKELSEKQLLKFATDKDIIKNASEKFATTTDAQKAVKTAVTLYLNKPFVEKEKIEFNDDIIDLKDQKISVTNDSITYDKANKLKVGDIIILPPTYEHVGGVARKVESILGNIINTTTPKLEEVYRTVQLSHVTVPKTSDIKPANEGVSFENYSEIELTSAKSKPQVTTLALNSKNNSDVLLLGNKGASFNVNINITKGKLSIDEGWNSLSGSFSEEDIKNNYPQFKFDKNGNMYTSKYKGGYEIKGKISISDLSLTNDVDFSLVKGLKKAETKVNFNASVNLSVKGKINETIDVFTTSIPIGTTGLWVDAVFSLVFDANGDVSVKCTLENTTTYTYERGLKSANNTKLNNKAAISGNLSSKVGPRAILVALGIDLFDIQAMIGLASKAQISAEQGTSEIPCVDVKVYAPTLSIAFAGDKNTLLNQLGFSAIWKVYDIDGGWQTPLTTLIYHYEAKNGWVDKCTHPERSKNNTTQINTESNKSSTSNNNNTTSTATASNNLSDTNWNYKNGGYDYIIKYSGDESVRIQLDMSKLPPEVEKDTYGITKNTIDRYNFVCSNNYIFFCQVIYSKYTRNDTNDNDDSSIGYFPMEYICKIKKDGTEYKEIGIPDEQFGHRNMLGCKDGYMYCMLGEYWATHGDVYRVKISDSLSNVADSCEYIFAGDKMFPDECYDIIKSKIVGDYIYYTVADDSGQSGFDYKIKINGT